MKDIPVNEIVYHPMSNGEVDIRLFWWQGKLYRAVGDQKASFYRELFDRGIIQQLIKKGFLVETKLTSLQLDGYDLVLEHRLIPFVSYPFEWCAEMLRDAALLVCDLQIELYQHGLVLKDPHSWNLLFDGPKPVYVDLGSIAPYDQYGPSAGYGCFCPFILYPLIVMSEGHTRIARWLLHDGTHGVLEGEVALLNRKASRGLKMKKRAGRASSVLQRILPQRFFQLLKDVILSVNLVPLPGVSGTSREFWIGVRKEIERIDIPCSETQWSDYYESFPSLAPSNRWKAKQQSVYKVLSELRPGTVLDVGGNRGWYAQMAADLGSRVVNFDTDDSSIMRCYLDAKQKDLSILPLVMNFTSPSPSYGVGDKKSASASERLQSDLVLGLALTHHLVFKQNRNFEIVVDALATFSKKWLLVEFIPKEDQYVRDWWTPDFSWYTLESFVQALGKHFSEITMLPSDPEPRVLLLCRRKR